MARVLHQEFYQDPVMGLIGLHRIEFTSAAPATEAALTFPALAALNSVAVVGGTARGSSITAAVSAAMTGLFDATIGVDGETITIGGVVYTTRASALTASTTANQFVAPAVQATKLANFINAVNGVGDGVTVGSLTRPHPLVYAYATGTAGTVGIVSRTPGTAGNAVVLAENCAGAIFAWTGAATLLAGGSGENINATVLTGTSSKQVFFTGFVAGDIIDVVTGHGNGSVNYTATA
jgi:hypothetical protein